MHAADDYVRFPDLLGFVFRTHGPAEADRLMTTVALEALRACGGPTAKRTFDTFVEYLTLPLYRSRAFRLSTDVKFAEVRQGLEKADQLRAEQSAEYGVEASASTAELADRRIATVSALRRVFPDIRYVVDPPGAVFVLELVLIGFLWVARKYPLLSLWLPVCLYAYGTILIASFSQAGGHARRYSDPFVPPALLGLLVVATWLYNEYRRAQRARTAAAPDPAALPTACG